jgi:hypothetical protein
MEDFFGATLRASAFLPCRAAFDLLIGKALIVPFRSVGITWDNQTD